MTEDESCQSMFPSSTIKEPILPSSITTSTDSTIHKIPPTAATIPPTAATIPPVVPTPAKLQKACVAKLLINSDGTLQLKADPNNFPTPGLKESHKLFGACSDTGQYNVYYSPSGDASEMYVLKPTSKKADNIFQESTKNPVMPSSDTRLIDCSQVTEKDKNPQVISLSTPVLSSTDDNNSILINKPSTVTTSTESTAVPLMIFSKEGASKLSSSTEASKLSMSSSETQADLDDSQDEFPVNLPISFTPSVSAEELSPTDSLAIADIGNTIASHLQHTEKDKHSATQTQQIDSTKNTNPGTVLKKASLLVTNNGSQISQIVLKNNQSNWNSQTAFGTNNNIYLNNQLSTGSTNLSLPKSQSILTNNSTFKIVTSPIGENSTVRPLPNSLVGANNRPLPSNVSLVGSNNRPSKISINIPSNISIVNSNNLPIQSNLSVVGSNNQPIQNNFSVVGSNNQPIQNKFSVVGSNNQPIQNKFSVVGSNNQPIQNKFSVVGSNNQPIQNIYSVVGSNNQPTQNIYSVVGSNNQPTQNIYSVVGSNNQPTQNKFSVVGSNNQPTQNKFSVVGSNNQPIQNIYSVVGTNNQPMQSKFSVVGSYRIPIRNTLSVVGSNNLPIRNTLSVVGSNNQPIQNNLPVVGSNTSTIVTPSTTPSSIDGPSYTFLKTIQSAINTNATVSSSNNARSTTSTILKNNMSAIGTNTTLVKSAEPVRGVITSTNKRFVLVPQNNTNDECVILPSTAPIKPNILKASVTCKPTSGLTPAIIKTLSSQSFPPSKSSFSSIAHPTLPTNVSSLKNSPQLTYSTAPVNIITSGTSTATGKHTADNSFPTEDTTPEDTTLNIRIDSVFSLSETDPAVQKKFKKKKKKKKGTGKKFKYVNVKQTLHCKPFYIVLERLDHLKSQSKIKDEKLNTQCSDHCRKRTLNCLCSLDLLDCKDPSLYKSAIAVTRQKVEVEAPSPSKMTKLDETIDTVASGEHEDTTCGTTNIQTGLGDKENKQDETDNSSRAVEHNYMSTLKTNSESLSVGPITHRPASSNPQSLLKNITYHMDPSNPASVVKHNTHAVLSADKKYIVARAGNQNVKTICPTKTCVPPVVASTKPITTKILNKDNTIISPTTKSEPPGSNKFYLVKVEGKSILIPANGQQPSKAYVLNQGKDGSTSLVSANLTYKAGSLVNTSNSGVAKSSNSDIMNVKSIVTGAENPTKIVIHGQNKQLQTKNSSPVTNISEVGQIENTASSENSALPVLTSHPQTNITPLSTTSSIQTTTPASDNTKKRKKTLAERYPLPPGVVIKQEPRTSGYGDETPVAIPVVTPVSKVVNQSLLSTSNARGFVQSKLTSHFLTRSAPLTQNTITSKIIRNRQNAPVVMYPNTNKPLTLEQRIIASLMESNKLGKIPPTSLPQPSASTTQIASSRAAKITVVASNSTTSTGTTSGSSNFPNANLQSTTAVSSSKQVINSADIPAPVLELTSSATNRNQFQEGSDSERTLSPPDSPGPPDLGEPQITLPTKRKRSASLCEIDNEDTEFTDIYIGESLDSAPPEQNALPVKKTEQDLRIDKLKEQLRKQEKALEELRKNKAMEEPISLDLDDL